MLGVSNSPDRPDIAVCVYIYNIISNIYKSVESPPFPARPGARPVSQPGTVGARMMMD